MEENNRGSENASPQASTVMQAIKTSLLQKIDEMMEIENLEGEDLFDIYNPSESKKSTDTN